MAQSNEPFYPKARTERLRADGNMNYLDFIRLVTAMWAELHPDIPIFPTQGAQYAKYPCIVYSLQMRKTHTDEPKKRYREEKVVNDNEITIIYGQRFQNIIKFSVVTKNDPHLAEAIIENFEDFMDIYTPVFKRSGLSEFMYARREPDDEQTRSSNDICTRTVAYLVTIEKIHAMDQARINSIVVSARIFLASLGDEFTVTAPDQVLTIPGHEFSTNCIVEVRGPTENQAGVLPAGLAEGWVYYVGDTTEDTVQLLGVSGTAPTITSSGVGRLLLVRHDSDDVDQIIEDQHQSTPDQ